ncbi:hypothetical protein PBI_PAPEZ_68 [Mycobacterium phage Papez]|uniref:hypothetical protein n=1 Tax=Mycobacterium phage Papez TaxID=1873891 RepID=UPI00080F2381|nr:hypothetical protein PBI_PAPEZ_68 [Mycobacterium phage Papez]ANT42035.1 hypothetical protein PBI_PAPEZ_68 [Mycobacterium phage Papez]
MTEKPWNPDPNDPALKARVTKHPDGRLSVELEDKRAVHELGGVLRAARRGLLGPPLVKFLGTTESALIKATDKVWAEEVKAKQEGRTIYNGFIARGTK